VRHEAKYFFQLSVSRKSFAKRNFCVKISYQCLDIEYVQGQPIYLTKFILRFIFVQISILNAKDAKDAKGAKDVR